jgi:ribosomal protein S18 acetylase RimI-like enzyme
MISKATLNDAAGLTALVNAAYRGDSSKKGWTTEADLLDGIRIDEQKLMDLIRKKDSMILKYTDEQSNITGCVHLEKHGDKLYLGLLATSPELQRKGIGKELLKAAEKEAEKLNCHSIYMTVITERTELIAWYVKHGYVNTRKKKPFLVDDPRFGIPKKMLEFVVLEKNIL